MLCIALAASLLSNDLISLENDSNPAVTQIELIDYDDWINIENELSGFSQMLGSQNFNFKECGSQLNLDEVPFENLHACHLFLLGNSQEEIRFVGIYLGEGKFFFRNEEEDASGIGLLSDPEWSQYHAYCVQPKVELNLHDAVEAKFQEIAPETILQEIAPETILTDEIKVLEASVSVVPFEDQLVSYFVNEQKMPLVLSPIEKDISLQAFQELAEANQNHLKALLTEHGAVLLRNFSVENADNFSAVLKAVLGGDPIDYLGGEGSRKRVAQGVYTSTEAPPQFRIPLHHELSCSNHPPSYISFYCDIAPEEGNGQTILGRTADITQEIYLNTPLWNLFNGRLIKYISRHPPAECLFTKVNVSHKTWTESFGTSDKTEVERICLEKGFEFCWHGDWIEVTRLVPAIKNPDESFEYPYWYNQVHLYHSNPRIRGGWLNHLLASLLYMIPTTRQYDVEFDDGSSIPQEAIYEIYDILERNTIKFDWQKGDVLILDNKKALHGRAPYIGQRRILVSMFK